VWVRTQWHNLVNLDRCVGLAYWYDPFIRKWTVRAYTGVGEADYCAICETDTEEAAQKVIDDIGSSLSNQLCFRGDVD
jgi:hypothetical protein